MSTQRPFHFRRKCSRVRNDSADAQPGAHIENNIQLGALTNKRHPKGTLHCPSSSTVMQWGVVQSGPAVNICWGVSSMFCKNGIGSGNTFAQVFSRTVLFTAVNAFQKFKKRAEHNPQLPTSSG